MELTNNQHTLRQLNTALTRQNGGFIVGTATICVYSRGSKIVSVIRAKKQIFFPPSIIVSNFKK